MPQHLREYVIELADRFPDMSDQEVGDAAIEYWTGAIAYRSAVIALYAAAI